MALRCVLYNWLYNKWYQPYRNDIEYHQFIAKLFYRCRPPPDMSPVSLITLINELHGRICDQSTFGVPGFGDQELLILQPLFKAVTIILSGGDFNVRVTEIIRRHMENIPERVSTGV
ncbi:General alpha-glucoside permease [Fusarium oxysporum f. sp. albedinis]|nr:General alpha-glucoside permease [Fusarium oxysporum f. sp. albedinis]